MSWPSATGPSRLDRPQRPSPLKSEQLKRTCFGAILWAWVEVRIIVAVCFFDFYFQFNTRKKKNYMSCLNVMLILGPIASPFAAITRGASCVKCCCMVPRMMIIVPLLAVMSCRISLMTCLWCGISAVAPWICWQLVNCAWFVVHLSLSPDDRWIHLSFNLLIFSFGYLWDTIQSKFDYTSSDDGTCDKTPWDLGSVTEFEKKEGKVIAKQTANFLLREHFQCSLANGAGVQAICLRRHVVQECVKLLENCGSIRWRRKEPVAMWVKKKTKYVIELIGNLFADSIIVLVLQQHAHQLLKCFAAQFNSRIFDINEIWDGASSSLD